MPKPNGYALYRAMMLKKRGIETTSPPKKRTPPKKAITLENEYKEWLKNPTQLPPGYFKQWSGGKNVIIRKNAHINKRSALNLLNSRRNNIPKNEYANLKNQIANKLNLKPRRIPGTPVMRKYSAMNNGKLVGFAVVQNRIRNNVRNLHLIVARKGVGRKIFDEILRNAIANGRSNIELHSVKSAVNAYKKWGFKNKGNLGTYQLMTHSLPRR